MTATFELHISDVKTYKSCRRRWNWSSPLREHLEPIITPGYFLVGRAVHFALATYYETGEMPADVFERYMQAEIVKMGVLWPDEVQRIEADKQLGMGMLNNYMLWIRGADSPDERWEIIATEMAFGPLPLHNPNGRKSNRIYVAGRLDGILRDKETGLIWLREFKTAGREPDPKWLDLDDQLVTYCWAAQQIIGEPVAGIQYRFLMKKAPTKPPRLKNGSLSRAINSPQTMSTTYDLYMEAITDLANESYIYTKGTPADVLPAPDDPELLSLKSGLVANYRDTLDELFSRGYDEYFKEIEVRKTPQELAAGAKDLWLVGLEMVRPTTAMYSAPDWLKCPRCPFRSPCMALNAEGNYQAILKHEFKKRVPEDVVEAQNRIDW